MFWLDRFRSRRFERDLDDELKFDLECRTQDNISAGMTPVEAHRQALLSLGGLEQTKEECRDVRPLAWIEVVTQDVRYGLRMLRRNPGFTLIAALSLAVGIGANSAIFSFIDAIATRPMPVPRVSEIIHISTTSPQFPEAGVSGADYLDYRNASSLAGVAAVDYRGPVLTIGDVPEGTYAEVVSDNFFTLLGIEAAVGRTFREETIPPPVIVLGHRFFQARFGGDPGIIGRGVRMGGRIVTIVGVAPASFRGTRNDMSADLWVPFSTWGSWVLHERRIPQLAVIGRPRTGVSINRAKQELTSIASNLARAYPATNKGRTVRVESDRAHRMRAAGSFSLVLMALVGAVLLLASMNVAILLLARAETRRREMAVRLALGAGRVRLVRQLLTEASLLAALGAVAGIALGGILIQVLPSVLRLGYFVGQAELLLDSRVLLFSVFVATGSGLLFGLAPAIISARADLAPVLKGAEVAAGTSGSRVKARNVLVVLQVGIALVLVVAGILLARSFRNGLKADLGFSHNNVLVLEIPNLGEAGTGQRDLLYRQVTASIRALPGVHSAAVAMRPPLGGSGGGRTERILLPGPRPEPVEVRMSVVGPGYFSLLGTRLLRGREFDDHDGFSGRKVAIINETGARRLWPSEDPIGKLFQTGGPDGPAWEIVGVSRDARINSISEAPSPYLYFPFAQLNSGDVNLLVRTDSSPATLVKPVRDQLKEIDSGLVVYASFTLSSLVDSALGEFRLPSQLASALALVGVLLAAVGLYGVISYFVSARTRETGIRMALGARPGDVLSSVLGLTARLAACGIALGIVFTLAAGKGLSSRLYGVSARDWSALAAASTLMLLVALAAGFVPARNATRTDPALTLRHD
ncbi:MAG TPA: ABC transporter permease [Bryobacteraceae bacterium]|nr:ABC transporter permease [Bryobacteraceae bacterium]